METKVTVGTESITNDKGVNTQAFSIRSLGVSWPIYHQCEQWGFWGEGWVSPPKTLRHVRGAVWAFPKCVYGERTERMFLMLAVRLFTALRGCALSDFWVPSCVNGSRSGPSPSHLWDCNVRKENEMKFQVSQCGTKGMGRVLKPSRKLYAITRWGCYCISLLLRKENCFFFFMSDSCIYLGKFLSGPLDVSCVGYLVNTSQLLFL